MGLTSHRHTLLSRFSRFSPPQNNEPSPRFASPRHSHKLALTSDVAHRSWTKLPRELGLNVDARTLISRVPESARLIHFLGEPKPWDERSRNSSNGAVRVYRQICAM